MEAEGTRFRPGVEVGRDVTWPQLQARYDAIVIATGATVPRELTVPGKELGGVHVAMEFLHQANAVAAGKPVADQITATGKHVIIIGGGDTGSDCLGTALRQGAASVTTLAIGKRPPLDAPSTSRGRPTRSCSRCRPRTPRAATATTSRRPSSSSATSRAPCAR